MITRETAIAAFLAHGEELVSMAIDNTVQTGAGLYARTWKWDAENERWTDQVGSEVYAADAHDERLSRRQADRVDGYDRDDLGESPDF